MRHDLPTGSVTLLFTDIDGSTRLIEELGEEEYVLALAEHRRRLRTVFSTHRGVEVDTQGDAFLYAFGDPGDALAAARQGQEVLGSGPVIVRMGCTRGSSVRQAKAMPGGSCTAPPASRPPATAARSFSPQPPGHSLRVTSPSSASIA